MDRITASDLLIKSEAVIVLDLCDIVNSINLSPIESKVVSDTNGIYLMDNVHPVLDDATRYYYLLDGVHYQFENLNDIISRGEDVYITDTHGGYDLYVSSRYLKVNNDNLHIGPTIHSVCGRLCSSILLSYVEQICKYARFSSNDTNIYNHNTSEVIDYLDDELTDVKGDLHEFTIRSLWNIYFCKQHSNLLIIEKMVDWRIYEWQRMRDGRIEY